jgi:predicted phage replisome organizer
MKNDNKKYFWLKLKNDFFDREEIKLIEAMPNGKDYIIFYMKLLLKSIENDGKLYFRNTIPYSPEMLASVTSTNIDTIKVAVDLFLKLGMMEKWDDGTFFMIETQNMIGSESKWAQYKRVQRNQKKEIGHCPKVSKKIPIDIEKERDIKSLSKEDDFDTSSLDGFIGKEVEMGDDILIINKISLLKNQKVEVIAKNKSSKKQMKAELKKEDLESLVEVVNV